MESIGNLLGRYNPKEPDEIVRVKQYINDQFHAASSVALQGESLVITVSSAGLANMLRLRALQLQEVCETTKKLIFRIG
ncbi:MAG: hypothetical protein ACQR33_04235 [Candidatus Saccharibacteria bacterium]